MLSRTASVLLVLYYFWFVFLCIPVKYIHINCFSYIIFSDIFSVSVSCIIVLMYVKCFGTVQLETINFLFGRSPPSHFSTSVYLRDYSSVNPLQGQCLYCVIIPHCLFILPADVISSCWFWPLTCHLPPAVAMVYSALVAAVQENILLSLSL